MKALEHFTDAEIESDFRLWSFYRYYDGPFAEVADPCLRFGKALVASIAPIPESRRPAMRQWFNLEQRKNRARGSNKAARFEYIDGIESLARDVRHSDFEDAEQ